MREGDKRNPTSPARCLLDKADFLYTYNSVSNLLFTCTCVPDKRFEYSPKTDEGSGRTHSSAHATWIGMHRRTRLLMFVDAYGPCGTTLQTLAE